MKNLKLLFVLTVTVIAFIGCSENGPLTVDPVADNSMESLLKAAVKPSANLQGEFYIKFVLDPQNPGPTWDGTVSFEGLEGEYGYRFFSLGARFPGQSFHFDEIYEFYDLTTGEVLLSGHDKGISAPSLRMPEPEMFRIRGEVEMATGPFELWLGRKVNVKGTVFFIEITTPDGVVAAPSHCSGELQIN